MNISTLPYLSLKLITLKCIFNRVMVTATNIKYSPTSLVFFNNFEEDRELGKGNI